MGIIPSQTPASFFQTSEYRNLHLAGLAEGISFLLLLGIAMPLKYLADIPQAVRIVGSLHGLLFIGYLLTVLMAVDAGKFDRTRIIMALLAAIIPFGPFWFEAKLRKEALPQ